MRKTMTAAFGTLLFSIAALAVLAALSAAQDQAPMPGSLIQQSDDLYSERADLTKAKSALAKLEEALAAKEDGFSLYWRMSRLSYWIGDHTAGNDAKKLIFQQGIEYAKRAVELGPDKPDGPLWL